MMVDRRTIGSSGPVPQPMLTPRSNRLPRSHSTNQSIGQVCGEPEIERLIYARTAGSAIQETCVGAAPSRSQN